MESRLCRICGNKFTPNHYNQKTCTNTHSIKCENCGKYFILKEPNKITRYIKEGITFCSRKCALQYKLGKPKQIKPSVNRSELMKQIHKNRTKEQKDIINNKISKSVKNVWDNRTEEQINSIKQKISDKYNNKTTSEKQLIKQHIKNGVQGKYNNFDEHTKNEIKLKQSLSHIELNKNRTKEQKQLISQHLSQSVKKYMNSRSEETIKTWKQKISISKSKSWQQGGLSRITWNNKPQEEIDNITKQVHKTKKLHGSYGKSKDEDILYKSLKNYCICSRQITLDKYSMDFELLFSNCLTYIELNGIYWHRDKPFENTEIDIATFNKLVSKGRSIC